MRKQCDDSGKTKLVAKGIPAAPLRWCCLLYARWSRFVRTVSRKIKKRMWRTRFTCNAVSYRIPQTVTKVVQYGDGTNYPICPRCSSSIDREYMAYCDRCGQRLGWRKFEQAEVCYPELKR